MTALDMRRLAVFYQAMAGKMAAAADAEDAGDRPAQGRIMRECMALIAGVSVSLDDHNVGAAAAAITCEIAREAKDGIVAARSAAIQDEIMAFKPVLIAASDRLRAQRPVVDYNSPAARNLIDAWLRFVEISDRLDAANAVAAIPPPPDAEFLSPEDIDRIHKEMHETDQ